MTNQINIASAQSLQAKSKQLLKELIAIPSFSKEENATANCIEQFLIQHGIKTNRIQNNIWATNLYFDESNP
jgi:acetylornithine deacetylase